MERYVKLEPGKVYKNRGGGEYKCIGAGREHAYMENVKSGWNFTAHVITMYEDGTIEWDYSTGGHFEKREEN